MREIKINEIVGYKIGHAQNEAGATGCTVILCEKGAVAGVDVRGGAPATRETELLNPLNMAERIHAVLLSGGSAFGLDAAAGVMAFLEERNIGFDVGVGMVPLVCGAALFDLTVGDSRCRPDKAMGYAASENAWAAGEVAEGNRGAGTGASVGKYLGKERMMKSGLGIYALAAGGLRCGAVVAVNALGDVLDADTLKPLAGILNSEKTGLDCTAALMYRDIGKRPEVFPGNTTIGCVITNGKLTKTGANKAASMAQDGYARVIRPVHTSVDGDTIFVMASGEVEVAVDTLGTLAAEVMARAINRAVLTARAAYGLKSAGDILA
ncbi:MAG: P1 family peptidase [Spirochaetaceae bacterium]|jgi:L-aminopeptidase/D-esterase-like protein|nr:P1 family peptidase [Spirochaetaceae bacterium]